MMVYLLENEVDQWYICVKTRLIGKQLRWIYGSFCRYCHQKRNKGTKTMLKFSSRLYCLVVIPLLYIICLFLEQKNTERRKKTRKGIRAMKTESNRKYLKNLSSLELTNDQEPAFAWPFGNGPVRVSTQGLFCSCLKTFIAPCLPTRMTALGLWGCDTHGTLPLQFCNFTCTIIIIN